MAKDLFQSEVTIVAPEKRKFIWVGLSAVEWELMRDIQKTIWYPASVVMTTALVAFAGDKNRLAQIVKEGKESLTIEHLAEYRTVNSAMKKVKMQKTPALLELVSLVKEECGVLTKRERIFREALCYFWQILLPHIDAVRECVGLPQLIEDLETWDSRGLVVAPLDLPPSLPDATTEEAREIRNQLKREIGLSRVKHRGNLPAYFAEWREKKKQSEKLL